MWGRHQNKDWKNLAEPIGSKLATSEEVMEDRMLVKDDPFYKTLDKLKSSFSNRFIQPCCFYKLYRKSIPLDCKQTLQFYKLCQSHHNRKLKRTVALNLYQTPSTLCINYFLCLLLLLLWLLLHLSFMAVIIYCCCLLYNYKIHTHMVINNNYDCICIIISTSMTAPFVPSYLVF